MDDLFDAIISEPPSKKQLKFIESLCDQTGEDFEHYQPKSKEEASLMIEKLKEIKEENEYWDNWDDRPWDEDY